MIAPRRLESLRRAPSAVVGETMVPPPRATDVAETIVRPRDADLAEKTAPLRATEFAVEAMFPLLRPPAMVLWMVLWFCFVGTGRERERLGGSCHATQERG